MSTLATAALALHTPFELLTLAGDRYVARRLALAFTLSDSWHDLFVACRYDHAASGYKGTPIAAYVDGKHFDGFLDHSEQDFEDLKGDAWTYRREHSF